MPERDYRYDDAFASLGGNHSSTIEDFYALPEAQRRAIRAQLDEASEPRQTGSCRSPQGIPARKRRSYESDDST